MLEWLLEPWPWYVSGPLIGLTVPILLLLTGRNFGISSSLRHLGAACMPNSKLPYLSKNYNWRDHIGSLIFVLGVLMGGFVGNFLLSMIGRFLRTDGQTMPTDLCLSTDSCADELIAPTARDPDVLR